MAKHHQSHLPSGLTGGKTVIDSDFTLNTNTVSYRRGLPPPRSWRFLIDGVSRRPSTIQRVPEIIPRFIPDKGDDNTEDKDISSKAKRRKLRKSSKATKRLRSNMEKVPPISPAKKCPPLIPEEVWAEAKDEDGTSYYYHTVTRKTSWDLPEGPNVRVTRLKNDDLSVKTQNVYKFPQKRIPDSECLKSSKNKKIQNMYVIPQKRIPDSECLKSSQNKVGESGCFQSQQLFQTNIPCQSTQPNLQISSLRGDPTPSKSSHGGANPFTQTVSNSNGTPKNDIDVVRGTTNQGIDQALMPAPKASLQPMNVMSPNAMNATMEQAKNISNPNSQQMNISDINRLNTRTEQDYVNALNSVSQPMQVKGSNPINARLEPVKVMSPTPAFSHAVGLMSPQPIYGGLEQAPMNVPRVRLQPMPYYYPNQQTAAYQFQGVHTAPGYSQNWGVVPQNWGIMPRIGVSPMNVVPGLGVCMTDPLLQYIDPALKSGAFEWTEITSRSHNRPFYFNQRKNISVWEKPLVVQQFEETLKILQRCISTQNKVIPCEKEIEQDCRPISSKAVQGTPWCILWTADLRVFFYNSLNKVSVWTIPLELTGRGDVAEMLKYPPNPRKQVSEPQRMEATSTTGSLYDEDVVMTNVETDEMKSTTEQTSTNPPITQNASESPFKKVDITEKTDTVASILDSHSLEEISLGSLEISQNNMSTTRQQVEEKSAHETQDAVEDEKPSMTVEEKLKETNSIKSEILAARQRAMLPIDARLELFTKMLHEKNVSVHSTWEKALHLIVYDPRYLLLTSKDRRTTFENYVTKQIEKEKNEKQTLIRCAKIQFMKYLKEVIKDDRIYYEEFTKNHESHESFKGVEKSKDREMYFNQHIQELRQKRINKMKAERYFVSKLNKEVKDCQMEWPKVKKLFDRDFRCESLNDEEREELFQGFQKRLKLTIQKSKENEMKREKLDKRDKTRKGSKSQVFLAPDNY